MSRSCQDLPIGRLVWVEEHCDNYHRGYWVPMFGVDQCSADTDLQAWDRLSDEAFLGFEEMTANG